MKRTLLSLAAYLAIVVMAASIYFSPEASAQGGTAQPATASNAILITSRGSLTDQGQYIQSTGSFSRLVAGTPTPTLSPLPTPPCFPGGAPGYTAYAGSYLLSNGDGGGLSLVVPDGGTDATVWGFPSDLPANPVTVEQGPASVTLQVDTTTGVGSGAIKFTSSDAGITGTITTTSIMNVPPRDPLVCRTPTPTPTPTFSTVGLTGRVVGPDGRGLRNVQVRLADGSASTLTSSLGFYAFDNPQLGATVTIIVTSKRFRFSPRTVQIIPSMGSVDFTGIE